MDITPGNRNKHNYHDSGSSILMASWNARTNKTFGEQTFETSSPLRLFRVIWGWFHDTWGVERLGSWNLHQRKFIHSIKRDLPASARLWDVEGVNMYQETTNTKRFPTLSSVVFSRFHPVSGSLLHCHTFCECNLNMKQAWPIGLR